MGLVGDIVPVGDAAVLVVLGDTIDEATMSKVWSLYHALRAALADSALDVVPAYGSVLVRFDPTDVVLATVMATVRGALEHGRAVTSRKARTIDVGVDFRSEHALDLADIARHAGLDAKTAVREFCQATYHVAFLGFSAGFPYLMGLPKPLWLPRLPTPRVRVPAGSVAIAGGQCGIYPRVSPGGWRIVGKTQANIFDPLREPASLLQPGDVVRFHRAESADDAVAKGSQ